MKSLDGVKVQVTYGVPATLVVGMIAVGCFPLHVL